MDDDVVSRVLRHIDRTLAVIVALLFVLGALLGWALREVDQTVSESACIRHLEAEFLVAVGDAFEHEDRTAVFVARNNLRAYNDGDRDVCP